MLETALTIIDYPARGIGEGEMDDTPVVTNSLEPPNEFQGGHPGPGNEWDGASLGPGGPADPTRSQREPRVSAKVRLQRLLHHVAEEVRRNPALGHDRELARWTAVLSRLEHASELTIAQAEIAIGWIIASAEGGTNGLVVRTSRVFPFLRRRRSAFTKDLLPAVKQQAGLLSNAVYVLAGAGFFIYLAGNGIVIYLLVTTPKSTSTLLGFDKEIITLVLIAGALGSFISLFSRVPQIARQRHADRLVLQVTGFTRPIIGAAFALFTFVLLQSGLTALEVTEERENAFFAAVAFIAGFSERLVPDLIGQTERKLGGGTHQTSLDHPEQEGR